ncbi:hypothetical protein WDV85_00330 [Pseudokineococcus sp. 5B2Z-1]|uniref:hypothetical protein n=1 Tax=Pseudokineococcus sp. 5B2Z-1 TaxID=3132744 RepID=UPI0030B6E491
MAASETTSPVTVTTPTTAAAGAPAGAVVAAPRVPRQHVAVEPVFERPATAGAPAPAAWVDERRGVADQDGAAPVADVPDRGTPLQALAGWGAALVLGAVCWGGALTLLARVV